MTLLIVIGLQGICPKNFKHIRQLSDIMLQHKTTSFASFSSLYQLQYPPSFSDTCENSIGRSSQIFRMISFKELKIFPNNTSKIIEFRQITRVLDLFLLPKPRITNFGTYLAPILAPILGETHWWFQKGITNFILWKGSHSLENNGTKILKIRATLFLSCTSYYYYYERFSQHLFTNIWGALVV